MDPIVIAAIIAALAAIMVAIIQKALPESHVAGWFTRTNRQDNLVGYWDSSWGPHDEKEVRFHETLHISRQNGADLWGTATRGDEPHKKWEIRGRFENRGFLQMYYFPSADSEKPDFLDYGCYFFRRISDGSFEGYSTGFGGRKGEKITTDDHTLKFIKK